VSGHNKWSSIKHRKAAQDAKRGAAFNKIIREIVVAAKEGGDDLTSNYALSSAIERAKGANMPKDTMEKAIKRGVGAGSGENYERLTYEGRGPAGTALIVTTLTDNKNRTVADVRHLFSKYGGTLAENGSVSWMFERKGLLTLKGEGLTEDELLEACAEAGAEDFRVDGEVVEVYCDPNDFAAVREWFKGSGKYKVEDTDLAMVPKDQVEVTDPRGAKTLLRLIDALEDNDDVQKIYSNWSMSDEMIEAAVGE
jgi:YebC/PmpR family DNA-binding regulatory protein